MGPLSTEKGAPDPPGEPKRRSKAPLGHHSYHFGVLFSMCFNSPGHRPRTCQIRGNNSSILRYCSLWVLDSRFPWVQKGYLDSILRRAPWSPGVRVSMIVVLFLAVQKSLPKSLPFFIDFGSQKASKIHPKITQNPFPEPSRNQPPKNLKTIQNQTPPNLENRALVQTRC